MPKTTADTVTGRNRTGLKAWFFRFAANYVHVPADNERYAAIMARQWVGWLEQTGTTQRGCTMLAQLGFKYAV